METNSIQALTEIVRHTPLATVLFGDRGIPRTWRHMNGYGSHSWINADGQISWVKYHFISDQGIECLTQEEADRLVSVDGDYHTRDLHEAIKRGEDPSWTLKMQIMSFDDAKNYRINPFDLDQDVAARRLPADRGRQAGATTPTTTPRSSKPRFRPATRPPRRPASALTRDRHTSDQS
jgi:catalase